MVYSAFAEWKGVLFLLKDSTVTNFTELRRGFFFPLLICAARHIYDHVVNTFFFVPTDDNVIFVLMNKSLGFLLMCSFVLSDAGNVSADADLY